MVKEERSLPKIFKISTILFQFHGNDKIQWNSESSSHSEHFDTHITNVELQQNVMTQHVQRSKSSSKFVIYKLIQAF